MAFSSGFISDLGKAAESELEVPRASTCTPNSRRIDRVNDNVVTLADFAGRGRILTYRRHTVIDRFDAEPRPKLRGCRFLTTKPVDSVSHHQDFAPHVLLWPTLHDA